MSKFAKFWVKIVKICTNFWKKCQNLCKFGGKLQKFAQFWVKSIKNSTFWGQISPPPPIFSHPPLLIFVRIFTYDDLARQSGTVGGRRVNLSCYFLFYEVKIWIGAWSWCHVRIARLKPWTSRAQGTVFGWIGDKQWTSETNVSLLNFALY